MIKVTRYLGLALLSAVLLSICTSGISLSAASGEDPLLLDLVAVRPGSGASYMADRQSFATMPSLESMTEVRTFVERYEATESDLQSVRSYLEDRGITVIAASNPLLVVSGSQSVLQEVLPLAGLSVHLSDPKTRSRMWTVTLDRRAFRGDPVLGLLDGAIIYPPLMNESVPVSSILSVASRGMQTTNTCTPPNCYTIHDVAELLRAERAQETLGQRGAGVRVGFIDEGLLATHPFFDDSPLEHHSYALVDGNITRVGNNYDNEYHGGHGTMVAAFLHTFAPDARLVSFSIRFDEGDPNEDSLMAPYMAYMHEYGLVDVLSLSQGWAEEDPEWAEVEPDVIFEMFRLIDDGVIILTAAGNAGQSYVSGGVEYDSGHNGVAGIPDVIAVGGSDSDLSAAGGYDIEETGARGAASFESTREPGRFVPDVVGIYGPTVYLPSPVGSSPGRYISGVCGTSGATPQIAGIVALLKGRHPSLNQFQVREILEQSAWDIRQGESGDGDVAQPGYDHATGHGLPLATWTLDSRVHLYRGWNLIGLIKEHSSPYSAVELLTEINDAAGYTCDHVSYWDRANSKYQGITVKENGAVYGFDFHLNLTTGCWVHCLAGVMWGPSGMAYVDTPQPLHVGPGFNFVSVPYTEGYCTASDLLDGFQGACSRLVRYDGQMQEKQESGLAVGYDFPLSPGQGYILQCNGTADWTPWCGNARESASSMPALPANVYPLEREPKLALAAEIAERREAPIAALDIPCKPQGVQFTNMSDQQVTVSWTTQDPCMGSVVLHTGWDPVFQAFDDRGLRFNGTTHHVTVRGLVADTTYSFGLLSGDYWDDRGGSFYQVSTGDGLSKQLLGQFHASGAVTDASARTAQDAVVYFKLQNRNEIAVIESALLSFPVYQPVSAFAITLDNARTQDGATSFAYTSATHLHVQAQGGSAGTASNVVPVNLSSMPSAELNDLAFSVSPPGKPVVHSPTGGVISRRPTFLFAAGGSAGQTLTYRLEISTDNFASVDRVYDQRADTTGWSSDAYEPGEQALFTAPEAIDEMIAYQWRVVATNGENWGGTSDISTFSYAALVDVYLPLVSRGATGSTSPGSTVTPQPSSTPFPIATGTPVIPTPSGPTFTPTSTPTPTPTPTPLPKLWDVGLYNSNSTGSFYIQYGDGSGAFGGQTVWHWGNYPNAQVFTGDFNGDELWDVGVYNPNGEGNFYIQYGNGAGGFGTQTHWNWGVYPNAQVFTGDFDGDALWDVGLYNPNGLGNFYIVYGDGTGAFGRQTAWHWGVFPTARVFTGDFNGDKLWDVGLYNPNGLGNFYIQYGHGAGYFDGLTAWHWGAYPNAQVFTGDFNGDDLWDVGLYNPNGEGNFYIQYGHGVGFFDGQTAWHWGAYPGARVFTGDFNGR